MRPAARRLCIALSALALSSEALAAPAQTATVQFSAPPSCPAVDAFKLGVSSRTDRIRFVEASADLSFQVAISERQGKFFGTLSIDHPGSAAQEPRSVDGVECAEVLESLALTAALSVDPEASLTPRKAPPEPPPIQPPPPPIEPLPKAPEPERVEWSLAMGALYALILTPGGMVGAYVEGGAHLPPSGAWRPLVALDFSYATTSVLGMLEQAEASWLGANLELCPARLSTGHHWITACAGGSLGVLDARGTELPEQREVTRILPGASLGVRGHVDLGAAWGLEFRARALFPLVKRRFYVNDPGDIVASTPTVAPLVSVGVVREF